MSKRIPDRNLSIPPASAASFFTDALMRWHREENRRQMPWKGERDPYKIWLSEIILQQTRVEQGWSYYERFLQAYPSVRALAAAPDADVFKLWEGLGYYARCRNLLKAARSMVSDYDGSFPKDYAAIRSLSGVGPYTAAAVCSFAFGLPHAVVDGNVLRVLSRFFGVQASIDDSKVRRSLDEWAGYLLYQPDPGAYNQAIMDFGATVCKPAAPRCDTCPLAETCHAHRFSMQEELPVRSPRQGRKSRWMYYLVIEAGGAIALRERTARDIWRYLYEPVLVESKSQLEPTELRSHPVVEAYLGSRWTGDCQITAPFTQLLTHQQVSGRFFYVSLPVQMELADGYRWVNVDALKNMAFPRQIRHFFDEQFPAFRQLPG